MHQWFDITSVQHPNEHLEVQQPGLKESVEMILDILKKEVELTEIPMDRIFLAGISQGCATAIHALLCSGVRLAGFVGLSGWLPYKDEIRHISLYEDIRALAHLVRGSNDTSIPERALLTPVFLSHSEDDYVVPVTNSEILKEGLASLGMQVELKRYNDGGHWVNEPRGVDDMVAFLKERIGSSG